MIVKRSDDGGKTWSKVRVIADSATFAEQPVRRGPTDDGPRVLLMFQSFPANLAERSRTSLCPA